MTATSPSPIPPCVLTIAGSDSGGGAGIQADLKTFQAHRVHGLTAITAVTAQHSRAVTAVHPVPLKHLASQLAAVFEDFPIRAVKCGMLGTAGHVRLVARTLARHSLWVVLDPVMIASSGAKLLAPGALATLREALIPRADVLTPNLPEAEALLGRPLRSADALRKAGPALLALGAKAVLLKGAHATGKQIIDRYYDAQGMLEWTHPRQPVEGHGTGCTLAAALVARLACGQAPRRAAQQAIAYVQRTLARSYAPGQGASHVLRH